MSESIGIPSDLKSCQELIVSQQKMIDELQLEQEKLRKLRAQMLNGNRSEERIFQANGAWWFGTREGDHGPFDSRKAAQDALVQFVLDIRGDIELNDVSILDKEQAAGASAWDTRPDVIR